MTLTVKRRAGSEVPVLVISLHLVLSRRSIRHDDSDVRFGRGGKSVGGLRNEVLVGASKPRKPEHGGNGTDAPGGRGRKEDGEVHGGLGGDGGVGATFENAARYLHGAFDSDGGHGVGGREGRRRRRLGMDGGEGRERKRGRRGSKLQDAEEEDVKHAKVSIFEVGNR